MTRAEEKNVLPPPFPDHTQLPDKDGNFAKSFQEHSQTLILSDSLQPVLKAIHPDGQYAIGQDSGIYWRETDPPEEGAETPDWFYIPNVPTTVDGKRRRSYVLWREFMAPLIALELASGDGSEERDKTPLSQENLEKGKRPGKFWVYEQIIRIPYYGIFGIETKVLEMYKLDVASGSYRQMSPNERGHYPIERLGVELGLWEGTYENLTEVWLRWWDSEGNLLPTGWESVKLERERRERLEKERQRGDRAREQAEQERQRGEQEREAKEAALQELVLLKEKLNSAGINPMEI